MKNIIMFGPPGCGKGTMSKMICKKKNFIHISTGQLLRKEIALKTPLGIKAKDIIKKGHFVSDDIVVGIVERVIANAPKENNGFVLDGFPRTINQAKELDNLLVKYGYSTDILIALTVDEDSLIKRMLLRAEIEGREDDKDISIIKSRFVTYEEKTQPLLDYYNNKGIVNTIDATEGVDIVYNLIKEKLKEKNIV